MKFRESEIVPYHQPRKKPVSTSISFDPDLLKKLDQLVDAAGHYTRSEMLDRLLRAGIAAHEGKGSA